MDELSLKSAKTREDLFDLLKFDRAKPAEAEAEAARRGWAPLAPIPEASDFDPMAEPHWTLAMAMAWIATRSIDAVRRSWNKYRAEYPVWRRTEWRNGSGGEVFKGWLHSFLEPSTSLGIELMLVIEEMRTEGQPIVMDAAGARAALWTALQEGLLPATGTVRRGGDRVTIPAEEWLNLLPRSERRDEVGKQGLQADYLDPWVPSRAVTHLWPAPRQSASLPPLMRPEGDGFMPLYCAARWIASRGGSREFNVEDSAVWQEAYAELLAAISSGKVRVVGLRSGERHLIPGHKFAGCLVDYPHADAPIDLLFSNDVYLRSFPYLDDQHWRNGFDDALVNRHGELYTQLMVDKGDVRERWPFETQSSQSGFPGRPTSKHLVMLELERRSTAGEMLPSVAEEGKALANWVRLAHPGSPAPTPKTVENQIRGRHRELRPPK